MLCLAGSIVMIFFVILAGLKDTSPLKETYFLRADTSGITGARDITQWTFFWICGDNNKDCGSAHAALPFGYAWSANPENAPDELVGSHGDNTTSSYYWYMWRFGWVLYLISLFFLICAFFSGFLSCLGRLGARLAGFVTIVALFFYSIAVSLMTVEFVKARNVFNRANREATVGAYAFGFSWGAWALTFLAVMLFCLGGRGNKRATTRTSHQGTLDGFFGRRRYSHRSGGVKEEYH